jgi:CcmD family protein
MTSEWRFIVAAYAITWVTLAGYAVRLLRLRRRAEALRDDAARQARGGGQ